MDYKNKYIKYKLKYLELKKQLGGANIEEIATLWATYATDNTRSDGEGGYYLACRGPLTKRFERGGVSRSTDYPHIHMYPEGSGITFEYRISSGKGGKGVTTASYSSKDFPRIPNGTAREIIDNVYTNLCS